jgi:hypothetical protein
MVKILLNLFIVLHLFILLHLYHPSIRLVVCISIMHMLLLWAITRVKVSTVRFDGAQEFGKSLSFQAFCRKRGIVMDPVAEYTHVQNARSENAIRVSKEHVRCLL